MLQVEGAVVDWLRGVLLLVVVARAQLLGLDVCCSLLPLFAAEGGQGVLLLLLLLLLGHPSVPRDICCLGDRGAADAVAASVSDLATLAVS